MRSCYAAYSLAPAHRSAIDGVHDERQGIIKNILLSGRIALLSNELGLRPPLVKDGLLDESLGILIRLCDEVARVLLDDRVVVLCNVVAQRLPALRNDLTCALGEVDGPVENLLGIDRGRRGHDCG